MTPQDDAGQTNEVPSSVHEPTQSSRADDTGLLVGILLLVCPLLILPSVEIPLALVSAATGIRIGPMRLMIDLAALLAMLAGLWNIISIARRRRVRRGRAGPTALWKEALRAEAEQNYEEALRLYAEIVQRNPTTTWAEDATSSIELLRKEGKI